MDKLTKRLLVGAAILIVFSFGICYKIRLNSDKDMKAAFETVKAQNEDLKTELGQIRNLLESSIPES